MKNQPSRIYRDYDIVPSRNLVFNLHVLLIGILEYLVETLTKHGLMVGAENVGANPWKGDT